MKKIVLEKTEKDYLIRIITDFFKHFTQMLSQKIQDDPKLDRSDYYQEKESLIQVKSLDDEGGAEEVIIDHNYSLHPGILQEFYLKILDLDEFSSYKEFLRDKGLWNEFNFGNFYYVKFGQILLHFIQYKHTITSTQYIDQDSFSFDFCVFPGDLPELLQIINGSLCSTVPITFYYFIIGAYITSTQNNFNFPDGLCLKLVSNHEKEQLQQNLHLPSKSFDIYYVKRPLDMSVITGYISGSFSWEWPASEVSTNNPYELTSLDLVPPKYIEMAFHLLNCPNTQILFYSTVDPYIEGDYKLLPTHGKVELQVSKNKGFTIDYPNELERNTLKNSQLEMTLNVQQFLLEFPKFINNLDQQSLEYWVFKRYERMLSADETTDIILESMIIIDSLISADIRDLSYQIRVKAPLLLCTTLDGRLEIQMIIKELYTIRSKLVHATGSFPKKSYSKLGGQRQAALYAQELTRCLLLRLLLKDETSSEITMIPQERLMEKMEKALIGFPLDFAPNEYFSVFCDPILTQMISEFRIHQRERAQNSKKSRKKQHRK